MTLLSRIVTVLAMASVASACCKRPFKETTTTNFQYICPEQCFSQQYESLEVYGTETYHEDSDICLSALHSGAIPKRGGNFTIIRRKEEHKKFVGSTLNRIFSKSKMMNNNSQVVYEIVKNIPSVTPEDVVADVVMVHNSYSGGTSDTPELSLSCIAQDPTTILTVNTTTNWAYEITRDIQTAMRVINSHKLVLMTSGKNLHAFRCLGRTSATDVLASISYPTGEYHSRTPTLRFSKGEQVTIPLVKTKQSLSNNVYIRRLPDDWPDSPNNQLPLQFGPAQLHHTGIYTVHSDKSKRNESGAYFDVMIRECEKDKYGVACNEHCPGCLHGGQCHPQTGTCVCPPGFTGDTCQYACLPGKFGAQCQLGCDRMTLEFPVTKDGDCRGLVICLPKPYGCSCASGYTYFDGSDNPICTKECPRGKFGADCSENCHGCKNNICNRFTGTCISRCQAGVDCEEGEEVPSVEVPPVEVPPVEVPTSTLWWLIIIPLFVIIIVILFIYLRFHKRHRKEPEVSYNAENKKQTLSDECCCAVDEHLSLEAPPSGVHTTAATPSDENIYDTLPDVQMNDTVEEMNPIYEEYTSENIYDNFSWHVSNVEVEAYLIQLIKSREAVEQFWDTADQYLKSTFTGQLPCNKLKNRADVIPYDEGRVLLSVVDDDPHSDYINASHVSGFGAMRYIGAQGPKDRDVSTLADFWRMIMEYDINAIIMIANFIEGGEIKVGEYMREGTTLTFDGHCVSVIERKHFPHFIVSTVQVRKGGESRSVQHYQYTSWPQYDVPIEASSLAQMIRHFQRSQCAGGTVVHCSTGSARTGTVLQVLLMHEMITIKGNFNPLDAVKHLRKCRAQLAESQVHYNFSLQVLDEILFGEETIVTVQDLQCSFDTYLENSSAEFIRIKALPSPLTYKGSSNPRFLSMNRNISVLPADVQRVQLQTEHGQPESQYINAVTLTGIHKEALLVTEHPLPVTLSKFWRLVVEKSCSLVLLLNTFDKQSKEEFPDIIPDVGDTWTLGDYDIQVQESQPYGNYLTQYTVNITNLKMVTHKVSVYQVLSWCYGQDIPPVPDILPSLAELLLYNTRGTQTGPPLLCCGDGVTACGLVAAMTLLIEQLQTEQRVDVYRTVVKLVLTRPQFITSEAQYGLLYTGAAMYIKNSSNYTNLF